MNVNSFIEAMAGIFNGREIIIKSNFRGKNIVIRVADTGPGIPERAIKHIFDTSIPERRKWGWGSAFPFAMALCRIIMAQSWQRIPQKEGRFLQSVCLPVKCRSDYGGE